MTIAKSLQALCAGALLATTLTAPTAQADDAVLAALKSAKVVELNFVWDARAPLLSFNPPYLASLINTHKQTKGWIPEIAFSSDMMYFSGQHGAPTIDAIGHISHAGKLFGGLDAEASEMPNGLTALGHRDLSEGQARQSRGSARRGAFQECRRPAGSGRGNYRCRSGSYRQGPEGRDPLPEIPC